VRGAPVRATRALDRRARAYDAVSLRFKVVVTRVETTEQWVRAADEEAAVRKIEEELQRSYAFVGSWEIQANEIRVVESEQTIKIAPTDPTDPNKRLMTRKDAAAALSVSYSSLYQMARRGEIEHTRVGSRYYMSKESLEAFIRDNTKS
jgi:excisionase family DNA binding protein